MDIARPDLKQKKKRRLIIWSGIAVVLVAIAAVAVYRLKPAAPTVDRSTIWTDTVKRGPMIRQVRGSTGTLVPREDSIELIPAQTDATVVRIRVLPGDQGHAGHHSHGPGRSAAGAGSAERAAGAEGRAGRLQEPAGHAAKHLDGQEDRRRRR